MTPPSQNFRPYNTTRNSKETTTASPPCVLKELSEKYFVKNAFDITFPAKAAAFFQERGIENAEKYLVFISNKVDEKMKTAEVPIKSPRSFAYKLIFEIDIAQEFLNREEDERIATKMLAEEQDRIEKRKVTCPCCGERFLPDGFSTCPKCDFDISKFSIPEEVKKHKRLLALPVHKQDEYQKALDKIYFQKDLLSFLNMTQEERDLDRMRKEELKNKLDIKFGLIA